MAVAAIALTAVTISRPFAPPTSSPAPQAVAGQVARDQYSKQCAPGKFDGRCLYDTVWLAFDQIEMYLGGTGKQRAEFAAWRRKFDHTGDLDCPDATAANKFACPSADRAIAQMVDSIGQVFDYYFEPDRATSAKQLEHSELEGIGASLSLKDAQDLLKDLPGGTTEKQSRALLKVGPGHELTVMADPDKDAPAAGVLKKGDVIVAVKEADSPAEPVKVEGMTLDEAVGHIRGKKGTKLEVTFDRTGKDGTVSQTVTITRAHVNRHVVHVTEIPGKAVVITIEDWNADTLEQDLPEALALANSKNLPVIGDFRNNPGGMINFGQMFIRSVLPWGVELEIVGRNFDSAEFFQERTILESGFVIVTRQNSNSSQPAPLLRGSRNRLLVDPTRRIGILINGGTASTSEIVALALQANHRATVVGTPSVHKDEAQEVINFAYGRRAHIPTYFFRPGGRPMQELLPDKEVTMTEADIKEGRDPQLDALVAILQEQVAADATRSERQKSWAGERDKWRRQSVCARDKVHQLPVGAEVTKEIGEQIAKSCETSSPPAAGAGKSQ
jgi:carboxyl-terminal processing protease